MLPPKIIPHIPLEELEALYKQAKLQKQARRYLAILEAYKTNCYPNLQKIADLLRVTPQTVGNWVRKWNEFGPEGLIIGKPPGRPCILTEKETAEFIATVKQSPRELGFDFSTWTQKKMRRWIVDKFGKELDLSTISRMLARHEIVRIQPRPLPAKGDPKKKNSLKKT